MAEQFKRLAASALPASVNTTLYTVPANTMTVANITICNRSGSPATYRIARTIGGSTTPTTSDYITYDKYIDGNDVHQITGLAMGTDEVIIAYASSSNITVIVDGIERS